MSVNTRREVDQWHEVCRLLKAAGAVTDQDLASPIGKGSTRGCALLNAIRRWGELNVALHLENPLEALKGAGDEGRFWVGDARYKAVRTAVAEAEGAMR